MFLIPLSLFLPIALFLTTGHSGFAEKLTIVTFILLLFMTGYILLREGLRNFRK